MDSSMIQKAEQYMLTFMKDSAHDKEHIYRVLNIAMEIARNEQSVDMSILIVSCLLHDIGRIHQYNDPSICHAEAGSVMAYEFLISKGVTPCEAKRVKECVVSHRFRSKRKPESIEAKILFDADTLDVVGAIGIARTLLYEGKMDIPLYNTDDEGSLIEGTSEGNDSFFREYHYKLKNIYNRFYTTRGKELAEERRKIAVAYYEALYKEITTYSKPLDQILRSYK